MTKSAAIYARVSSERQARDHTIASQVAALRERVTQDSFVLSDALCFVDDGCSGSTLLRPALERLRDAAAQGLFDRLYVLAPDRLARRQAHQALLLDELERCHIEVVFLSLRASFDGKKKRRSSRGKEERGERGVEGCVQTGCQVGSRQGSVPRGRTQGPRGLGLGSRNLADHADEPWPQGQALLFREFVVCSGRRMLEQGSCQMRPSGSRNLESLFATSCGSRR